MPLGLWNGKPSGIGDSGIARTKDGGAATLDRICGGRRRESETGGQPRTRDRHRRRRDRRFRSGAKSRRDSGHAPGRRETKGGPEGAAARWQTGMAKPSVDKNAAPAPAGATQRLDSGSGLMPASTFIGRRGAETVTARRGSAQGSAHFSQRLRITGSGLPWVRNGLNRTRRCELGRKRINHTKRCQKRPTFFVLRLDAQNAVAAFRNQYHLHFDLQACSAPVPNRATKYSAATPQPRFPLPTPVLEARGLASRPSMSVSTRINWRDRN